MDTVVAAPPNIFHAPAVRKPTSLVARVAGHFHVEPAKLLDCLKNTCFRQAPSKGGQVVEPTNEEMMALLIVADQYRMNPILKELYAYRDWKRGGIVPIVGIDGWIRIVEQHPQFAGCTFEYHHTERKLDYIECTMYRKDRAHPMSIPEYLIENRRDTEAWTQMPHRMLRHRAYIQAARYAFGFAGIYDPDEGAAIVDGTATVIADTAVAELNAEITGKPSGKTIDELVHERIAANTPQPITLDDVRDALNDSAKGPYEAFAAAMDLMNELKDPADVHTAEELANKLMHERADREAAKE